MYNKIGQTYYDQSINNNQICFWKDQTDITGSCKIEVPRVIESYGETGLNIRTNANRKSDSTKCLEEEESSVGMSHSLQILYGNLIDFGKKVNFYVRTQFDNKITSWSNV